ncbi:hypothetical protein [Vibrio quintilis]|uniref:hypothetical protein n=1 Tax=Vibrio quintilis TaxID=1117707 RepID=UPI00116120CB|nr:hypothetical protein [Vibrio quintilis]
MTTTEGCRQADPDKTRCIHLGAPSSVSVNSTPAQRVKSVSVDDMNSMAEDFRKMKAPMITVNDEIDRRYRHTEPEQRKVKNLELGMALGELAPQVLPEGGTVCLLATEDDSLTEKRIQGVRMMLSGDDQYPPGKALSGENGWQECASGPLDIPQDIDLRGNEKLIAQLGQQHPEIVIAVSYWPLTDLIQETGRNELNRRQVFAPEISVIVGADGKSGKDMSTFIQLQSERGKSENKANIYIYLPEPGRH